MESHELGVPHPLFALTGSQRGWHQRGPLLRLGTPNLAEFEAVPASSGRHCRALPRLAVLSLHPRTLPRSCPNIAPAVMKLVVVALG